MKLVILLLTIPVLSTFAQTSSISTSDSYITLKGEKYNGSKIMFTRAQGDWFSTSTDAHSRLTLYATFDKRELIADMEWDGKNNPHILTFETRHSGLHDGELIIILPDKDANGGGLNASPDEGEMVSISVTNMDNLNVSAQITGNISSGTDHLTVNCVLNLKKTSVAKVASTALYKDCDNVVHDKLVGAEDRSATRRACRPTAHARTSLRRGRNSGRRTRASGRSRAARAAGERASR